MRACILNVRTRLERSVEHENRNRRGLRPDIVFRIFWLHTVLRPPWKIFHLPGYTLVVYNRYYSRPSFTYGGVVVRAHTPRGITVRVIITAREGIKNTFPLLFTEWKSFRPFRFCNISKNIIINFE